jgi:hypothetical protein
LYDSKAASMPASSSGDSSGPSSLDDFDNVAACRQVPQLEGNVLAVPGHNPCASRHSHNSKAEGLL